MKELKVLDIVGRGGFITDGGKFIWDSDEDNNAFLVGENITYKIITTNIDDRERPISFIVE